MGGLTKRRPQQVWRRVPACEWSACPSRILPSCSKCSPGDDVSSVPTPVRNLRVEYIHVRRRSQPQRSPESSPPLENVSLGRLMAMTLLGDTCLIPVWIIPRTISNIHPTRCQELVILVYDFQRVNTNSNYLNATWAGRRNITIRGTTNIPA